nr:AMP-binding protein [Anaerolineales bacterium]
MTDADPTFGGEFVWRPTPAYTERAHLTRFMARHGLADYAALLRRSTADIAWFTTAVLEYLDIQFAAPYQQVLDLSRGPRWPRWCVGGRLNIVQTCLDRHFAVPRQANRPALLWEDEAGHTRRLSYADLHREVNHCANALRQLGFRKGDALGLFMPMTPEIVIAFLAIIKIGGVVLPLFSGFGAEAAASRLNDASAAGLITADGFFRRGHLVPLKPVADAAAAQVPTLREVLVVRHTGNPVEMKGGRDHWWHDEVPEQSGFAETEIMEAEDPLMIIYTSGTTGRPKGAVHTHCGFPVKAAQDMAFHMDVHGPEADAAGDSILWLTDMGWMMGPWLVFGSLILGATLCLYDGAPDYPGPDRLWALVERHALTHLGLSPTLVRALSQYGEAPVRQHALTSLRIFASTGEPWNPAPWQWLFQTVGQGRRPIINYTGGTEIAGGIISANPLLPLKPCAFSAACPGMDVDVVDEAGQPVRGQVGELVIRQPWIGMTRGFWKDPARFEATYWGRWPDLWVHGD